MEVQVRREDGAALNKESFGSNAIQFPDMPNIMHILSPTPSPLVLVRQAGILLKGITRRFHAAGYPNHLTRNFN
jgi:hypothetical protein